MERELYFFEVNGDSYRLLFRNNASGIYSDHSNPFKGDYMVSVYAENSECVLRRHDRGFEIEKTINILKNDIEPIEENIPRIIEMLKPDLA